MRFDIDSHDPAAYAVTAYANAHPSTQVVHPDPLFVAAVGARAGRRVALVSGGGSGHEPLHNGLVGPGGLDAAVPGRIFASPHSRQVYEAALAVARPDGVLLIVKNYTGDVVNFGIAAERIRAHGIETRTLLVGDDLATGGESEADMRGTAATVIVEQILAAFADDGASLDELVAQGEQIVARSRSIAVADVAHHSHATGERAFSTDGGLEFGVGIHGERASQVMADSIGAEVVSRMVDALIAALPAGTERIALLCNDLGAMSAIEVAAVTGRAAEEFAARGVAVALIAQGAFVTALDMRGFSLTATAVNPEFERILQRPHAPLPFPVWDAWHPRAVDLVEQQDSESGAERAVSGCLGVAGRLVDATHTRLTALDQRAGDGDFGDNMAFAIDRARARWGSGAADSELAALRDAFLDDVGGSSGPLFGLVLQCLSTARRNGGGVDEVARGVRDGMDAVRRLGGAQVGDSTMVDALEPAARVLSVSDSLDRVRQAVQAAMDGAASTAELTARKGRARYVGERTRGVTDPGAVGAVILIAAVLAEFDDGLEQLVVDFVETLPA